MRTLSANAAPARPGRSSPVGPHILLRARIGRALWAACLGLLPLAAAAQDIPLRHVVVDAMGPVDPWGKSIGDLNQDGKPDLIVGGSKSGGLVWYQNPSWTRQTIAASGQWSTDHEVVDVDRDGDRDVVALTRNTLCWYENPSWVEHRIDRRVLHDIEVADFDGDGDSDIVGRNQGSFGSSGATLHFYRHDSPRQWTHREVECPDGEGLATGDLDGDGDTDVCINAVWFENTGNIAEGPWKQHRFAKAWNHAPTFVALADFNADGRLDVVLAPAELAGQRYRIAWFESPGDNTEQAWIEHVVDPDVEAVHHFVGAADMDLDGDVDVVAAEMEQGRDPDEVKIYRNNGGTWSKQVIARTGSHSMRIVDIDGDGDFDLFGANWQGHTVDLWVNETR